MSAFSPHLNQFRHDLQQQAIPDFTQIPGLSLSKSTRNFLQGHMDVDRNGKRVLAEPTTDTASA